MRSKKVKKSVGSRVFDVCNILFLSGMAFICMSPFLYVVSASISPLGDVLSRSFFIYPKHIDLSPYRYLFSSNTLLRATGNSLVITLVGTVLSMTVTVTTAYVLSKPQLLGRKVLNGLVVFTMLFSGGMIPSYLITSGLHLNDTWWALWLPHCVSAYNMILIRTSISALPSELEEAAVMDGCNYLQSFVQIVLPLIKPTLATFSLFYAVGYWNNYFSSVLYINDSAKYPIQIWLRNIIMLSSGGFADTTAVSDLGYIPPQNITYAVIVFATIPILCVYPFVQRYFTKGVMAGSIKG